MDIKRKTVLSIIAFVAFLGLVYFAYTSLLTEYRPEQEVQSSMSTSSSEAKKNPAKDFTVYDAQGNAVKLSDFKGKPIVLNFWASWCTPCKSEMPHFNDVYADVKDEVQFMMVDLTDGQRETQAKAQSYVKNQGYDFPVFFDLKQNAAMVYAISSIPSTIFIDSDGNIVESYVGPVDKKTLIKAIDLIKK